MAATSAPKTISKLFQPIRVGNLDLKHRVVLAPLTRFRNTTSTYIPVVPLVKEYYSQRSSTPGTLVITEGAVIAPKAGGYPSVPGIWSKEQIEAWKQVTDAVHANGSYIFMQLWAVGRAASEPYLKSMKPPMKYVAPSPIALSTSPTAVPEALTVPEIREYVEWFAQAAKNAVNEAGFDGVEIHGANGYLIDQFLQDVSNKRTDEYGGNVENRSRFGLQVVDAVVKAVGAPRTSIRLSPWDSYQDMKMADPVPQFSHFVSSLKASHPDLAYIHVIGPRVHGIDDRTPESHESNDFIRDIWAPRPFISAGGYKRELAIRTADEHGDLIAFGRWFIANPDLPIRLKEDIPLTQYDRSTFYTPGENENAHVGYIDYPFATTTDKGAAPPFSKHTSE